jgi:hypothetical protein
MPQEYLPTSILRSGSVSDQDVDRDAQGVSAHEACGVDGYLHVRFSLTVHMTR